LRLITAEDIARTLTYSELVDALRRAFRDDIAVPLRHHHTIPTPGGDATLLLMPAWTGDRTFIGCKLLTVFPDNATRGKPSVYGSYVLLCGASGEPLAVMDGRELTAWRTAAASALAATYLASAHASHLVMIGAGVLAPYLIAAHAAVRPVRQVTLWNRTRVRAEMLAGRLAGRGLIVAVTDNLEAALGSADIVSCATLAHEPLVRGVLLKAGAHVDLVGGFTPAMREADDATVRRASLYVDTREGAREKAGDIVDPIRRGIIKEHDVRGDLFELCRGTSPGRRSTEEITLFKSVGSALEDLAAAMLVWERFVNSPLAANQPAG
jgi:alanine dehydrogenase